MALRQTDSVTQYRANVITTAAELEVVSLSEFKAHLRLLGSESIEDEYLIGLLDDCTRYAEDQTGLALGNQTWTLWLDNWPGYYEPWWNGVRDGARAELYSGRRPKAIVELPRFPLRAVDNVYVYDEDSVETEIVVADLFDIDTHGTPGRMSLKYGRTWPEASRSINAVKIVYTAGYGTEAYNVPSPIRRAILLMAASVFTHRGDGCTLENGFKISGAKNWLSAYSPARL